MRMMPTLCLHHLRAQMMMMMMEKMVNCLTLRKRGRSKIQRQEEGKEDQETQEEKTLQK